MVKATPILVFLIILCITPSHADDRDGGSCWCPQRTQGWLLYDDDNPTVPDFFRKGSVEIREILVCDHGMYFFFLAKQDEQQFLSAFVIVKPTAELFKTRPSTRYFFPDRNATIQQRVDRALAAYECCRRDVESLLGDAYAEHARIEFRTQGQLAAPRLRIRMPLKLEWRGQECVVTGYIDVYFSKIS